MWSLTFVPLLALLVSGALVWHHATDIDRRAGPQGGLRQPGPNGALGLVLGALVAAVTAATALQLMFLPRLVE